MKKIRAGGVSLSVSSSVGCHLSLTSREFPPSLGVARLVEMKRRGGSDVDDRTLTPHRR